MVSADGAAVIKVPHARYLAIDARGRQLPGVALPRGQPHIAHRVVEGAGPDHVDAVAASWVTHPSTGTALAGSAGSSGSQVVFGSSGSIRVTTTRGPSEGGFGDAVDGAEEVEEVPPGGTGAKVGIRQR